MKITFYGAAEMVTGSCYLCEFDNLKLLIDCGMFQGGKQAEELNYKEFEFNPIDIDYVLLTHAHIDHSGRIPQLVKRGFKGKIITTTATHELCKIMLPDSAFIQEMETEWVNRKNQRAGKPLEEPIYTVDDANEALRFFNGIKYNELFNINSDITIRLKNAGHILGSAIIEMWIREKGEEFKIVFSGDLGSKNAPLMQYPSAIDDADYVIMESTYGNRHHKDTQNKALMLLDIITDTVEKGGNVVIPSFAIERTQEILYELNMLKESKTINIKNIPVYVDSPLAINATKIFENNIEYLSEDVIDLVKTGDNPFHFPNLIFTETAEESKEINFRKESCIIISASGMCEAGRIKHHLKHNLWRDECSIVFVGYQAKDTLGRRIKDGEKTLKIFGEEINIKSKIYTIEGFSGHADQSGLLEWIDNFKKKPTKIFITHGEDEAILEFSKLISENFSIEHEIPKMGQTIELTAKFSNNIIKDRYYAQKENIVSSIKDLKKKFDTVFNKMEKYINKNDNIKLDTLYYIIDKIDQYIDDIKEKIK